MVLITVCQEFVRFIVFFVATEVGIVDKLIFLICVLTTILCTSLILQLVIAKYKIFLQTL